MAASVSIACTGVSASAPAFKVNERVAQVEQVKADDQQPIDGWRHARILDENVVEKDLTVLGQRAREPDGEPDAGAGVDAINGDEILCCGIERHNRNSLPQPIPKRSTAVARSREKRSRGRSGLAAAQQPKAGNYRRD